MFSAPDFPTFVHLPFPVHEFMDHSLEGIQLAFLTFILTVALELWSLDTVKKVLEQKGGTSLYSSAVSANLRNHFIFGWLIFATSATFLCRRDEELNTTDRIGCVLIILFVHSLLFYAFHRAFHTYPTLYRHHRFHHKFNVNVPPMAANAVSPVEYIVAYILPFTASMPIAQPDTFCLRLSVAIVSVTNLLIHTPKLCEISSKMLPAWAVSTHDHLEHHRKLNTKYAAPTFNIDFFVSFIEGSCSQPMNPFCH